MMGKNGYRIENIIENMPAGYAYHEMVYDQNNNPIDYIFREVNNKFEELTGLSKKNIIDKKASNIFDKLRDEKFDWVEFYGEIALKNGSKTIEKYFQPLDKWFKITASSEDKKYFTTVFYEITGRIQKEKKLRKEKKRLNNIFNNLDDIIWAIEWPSLEVQFISKSIEDMIGYTRKDFKEDPDFIQKITHPEDKDINEKALQDLKKKGYAEREFRIITKEGSIKWLYDKGKMIYNKNNEPVRVEGVMRDITNRKRAEKKLKYSRELYETIFNSAPLGIIIENDKGDILEANDTECEITGYTKEELEGSNVIDKFVLPEYQDLAKRNIKNLVNGKDLEFDIKTPKKNGEIIYEHLKETNITFPDGEKGIISMHVDITERKEMEKRLKMLDFTINKADMLIFRLTPQGIIEYVNETVLERLNYNKDELIEANIKSIIKDEDYIERDKFWNIIKNSGAKVFETNFKTKKGDIFPVERVSQYFKYEDKEYEFAFAKDITERKEKEDEIRYLLHKDSLTGLYNRRYFEEEMKRLDTKRQLPLSIIMCDVNGLKIINDSYGHKKGDEVLIETAQILRSVLRDEDVIARHGGDEFTLLLPQTSHKQGQKIIDRIRRHSKTIGKEEVPLSMSLGIATKTKTNQSIQEVLKKADNDMYRNKLSESRSTKNKIVENLLNTLEAKSSETKEHAVRMTKLASRLGEEINLSNSEMNRLSLLATLHDIGKTTISEGILTKPDKPTDKEWEIIKEHPERGYKIASASEEFALVAEEILFHHERWDGKGYPEGLSGEEIPYLSRIIAIIDAYDVMTNDRPYSQAINKKEALAEIENCAGGQFDPKLAKEFTQLIKKTVKNS